MQIGDKVKLVNPCGDIEFDANIPVGSIGILTMKDSDEHLNHYVTFNDLGVSEWFKSSELELVE